MTPKNIPQITSENYEEYLILSLDGELNSEEEAALQAFLQAHPTLAEAIADYEAVKMPLPEITPVFEGKESLLKPEGEVSRKTISFRPFLWTAAAVLLLWAGVRFFPTPEETPQIAIKNPPVKITAPQPQTPVEAQEPIASSKSEKTKFRQPEAKIQAPHFQTPKEAVAVAPQEEILLANAPQEEIISPLPFQQEVPVLPTKVAVPEAPKAVAVVLPTPRKTLPSGIAVEVPVLEELRTAAADKVLALRAARRSLKETEATVSVANRPLFTIRF